MKINVFDPCLLWVLIDLSREKSKRSAPDEWPLGFPKSSQTKCHDRTLNAMPYSPPTVLADARDCLRLGSEGFFLPFTVPLTSLNVSRSYAAMLHAKHMSTSNCPE